MNLSPLQLESLKACVTKVNVEKLKDCVKHIDDSYLRLAKAFVLAYTDLTMASKKLTDETFSEQLLEYLSTFREFEQLFLFLDSYEHSFAKTKYRNKIIFLIQGREMELRKFVGFYCGLFDMENAMMSGMSGWFS